MLAKHFQNPKGARYPIDELLELGKSYSMELNLENISMEAKRANLVKRIEDAQSQLCPKPSVRSLTMHDDTPSRYGQSSGSYADDVAQLFGPDTGTDRDRTIINPPRLATKQNDEGFAQFLRQYSSPTHNRVTAGGRIVPMGPPPKRLSFSNTNNNRDNAGNAVEQEISKTMSAKTLASSEKEIMAALDHMSTLYDPNSQFYRDLQAQYDQLLQGFGCLDGTAAFTTPTYDANIQSPLINHPFGFPLMYQQIIPGVVPIPSGLVLSSDGVYKVASTEGLPTEDNLFLPLQEWRHDPRYPTALDAAAFGHQIPHARSTNAFVNVQPHIEQLYDTYERHLKHLEAEHALLEQHYALNGPRMTDVDKNGFYRLRKIYNEGENSLRQALEKLEQRLPAFTKPVKSKTLNIHGEPIVERTSRVSFIHNPYANLGSRPLTLAPQQKDVQTSTNAGFQALSAEHAAKVTDRDKVSDMGLTQKSQSGQSDTGAGSLLGVEDQQSEFTRRCRSNKISAKRPTNDSSPPKDGQRSSFTGSYSNFVPIAYEGSPLKDSLAAQDRTSTPLTDRSNEREKPVRPKQPKTGKGYQSPVKSAIGSVLNICSRITGTRGSDQSSSNRVDSGEGLITPQNNNTTTESAPYYYIPNDGEDRFAGCRAATAALQDAIRSPTGLDSVSSRISPRVPKHLWMDGANDEISSENDPFTSAKAAPSKPKLTNATEIEDKGNEACAGKPEKAAVMPDDNNTSGGQCKSRGSERSKQFLREMLRYPRYYAAGEDFDLEEAAKRELQKGYKPSPPKVDYTGFSIAAAANLTHVYPLDPNHPIYQFPDNTDKTDTKGSPKKKGYTVGKSGSAAQTSFDKNMSAAEIIEKGKRHKAVSEVFKEIRDKDREEINKDKATHPKK